MNYGARKYLEELEQENGDGEPIHQQDKVSTTDPDSTYLTKGNRAAELGYLHTRQQVDLCFQLGNQIRVRDQYQCDEGCREHPGR